MPYIYISKVNYNSKIYDVYKNTLKIEDILEKVFNLLGSDDSKIYKKETTYSYENIHGVKCKKLVTERYFFNNLKKQVDNKVITGSIIREYPRYSEKFDEELKKIVSQYIPEASSIYFYFDVKNELIAFCTRNKFGYNQFNEAFKGLLELSFPNQGFEVFLKKDKSKVQQAVDKFKRIDKIIATVIPPNANSEINELLKYCTIPPDNNIAKAKLEYESSPLNDNGIDKQGELVQNLVKTVSSGYGDLNIHGKYEDDSYRVFKSNKEAPVTSLIDDDSNEEEFISNVKDLIWGIASRKE